MKTLLHILSALILFTIPAIPVLTAVNLVIRAPDLYVYEFTKAKSSRELDLTADDKALGALFSDFMAGKQDEFVLYADFEEHEGLPLSTAEEAEALGQIRSLLNESLILLAAAILITGITYWILIHYNRAEEIRRRFLWSLMLFLGSWAIALVLLLIEPNLIHPESGVVLSTLFTPHFIRDWFLASFSISAVIFGIFASASWRLTRPKRLFR